METVNDLDGALVTFWKVLRERPAELARVCALTPHWVSRAEWKGRQVDLLDVPAETGDPDGCSSYGCRSGVPA